ncbi:MAG: four helix bundle protein [Oscillospiraceae bacterium]|nr:four helix bundle protein [Oscillospiraceae bacterium]
MEQKNQLREDALDFAITVSDMCDKINSCSVYKNQLIRSSSSIGANIFEARYAQSNADFISKLEIALKECYETEYWMELLYRKHVISDEQFQNITNQCGSIRRRLIASVKTMKAKNHTSSKEVV